MWQRSSSAERLGLTVWMKKPSRRRTRRCVTDVKPMVTSHPRESTWTAAATRASNPHLEHVRSDVAKLCFCFFTHGSPHFNFPTFLDETGRLRFETGNCDKTETRSNTEVRLCATITHRPVGTPQFMRAPRPARVSWEQSKCRTTATPCGQNPEYHSNITA